MSDLREHTFTLPAEQQTIRDKCFHPSGTFVEFPFEDVESSVPARFDKVAQIYSKQIAVETDNERITYDSLNRTANLLANLILTSSDNNGSPIGIVLHKGIAQITAILGVLKSGRMFLLQDPNSADNGLAQTLSDAHTTLVITSNKLRSRLSNLINPGVQVIDIDVDLEGGNDQNPTLRIPPNSGAYIKYTSGSTARSKGTIIPHRTILNAVMGSTNSMHFCPADRAVAAHGNTISRLTFIHLLNGATYCPFDLHSEGMHCLAPWMEKHHITLFRSFPGAFRLFVSTLTGEERFSDLRIIRLGGEPLYRSDVELFKKHFSSDCVLINAYGSTETSAICSYYFDRNREFVGHRLPVGFPANGKDISIIDDSGKELPSGKIGEIVVKSRFLASGYWRPGRENDFGQKHTGVNPDFTIYRTGDLGFLSQDGCLTHLGRKDERVKIRNFRVDLGEVEATLAEHPGVKMAAVVAREDDRGDLRLLAYYVAQKQPAPTVASLREFMSETLPAYMIPSLFLELPKIPTTRSGKLDRRALPDPGRARPHMATPFVAACTPIEITLSRIWADVLQLASVGIHDDFFELGGHSLSAARVVARTIKTFRCDMPIKALFNSPTVADMAALIAQSQSIPANTEEVERLLSELERMSELEAEQTVLTVIQRDGTHGK